jgi:putative transcriptional regulator
MPAGKNQPNREQWVSPLKQLRLQVGLTQAELAKQIPDKTGSGTVSRRAISAWERGEYQPELTIPQVKALCRALKVTLNDLPDDCRPQKVE